MPRVQHQQAHAGIESFLQQYDLSTQEGVLLMCVAEALLRIPDAATADALLRDKLAGGQWSTASAADWALLLTGTLVRWHDEPSTLKNLISRLGEPVVRTAVRQAMQVMASMGVHGPHELRPHMLRRRVDHDRVASYDEMFRGRSDAVPVVPS